MNLIEQSEEFRRVGHELIDYLADYLVACHKHQIPVTTPITPDDSLAFWNTIFLNPDIDSSKLFKLIISRSIHLHHPGYIGHQVAAGNTMGILADMMASALDNGMAVYEMGQVSVVMEKIVCNYLAQLLGWGENADGIFTSGGTLANLTALLAARQVYSNSSSWEDGNHAHYAIMVSKEAHYSVDRAIKIMGHGNAGVIHVPVDTNFKIDISALHNTYDQAVKQGKKIFAFVANAGSTSTGSYDDLESVAAFCKEKKIWMHVDGAHGGAVLFSDTYRDLIKGIEFADSMTLDFHKLLQTPILCTTVLFKNQEHSYETFTQGAKYLFQDQSHEWYQLGKRTFECTKPMMVLKAFTVLHRLGKKQLGKDIDHRYFLARYLANQILEDPEFELAVQPESNIVCFKPIFKNKTIAESNALTGKLRKDLLESGEFYIVQNQIGDAAYLRCSIMNIHTTEETINSMLSIIKNIKSTLI